jgi:prepilin-type processing-associated H-X9-DG protein
MKQIALGAANYESSNQTFPIGRYYANAWGKGGATGGIIKGPVDGWSHLARLLNYTEQQAVYNAINFSDTPYGAINSTAESVGITTLWCPSDGTIAGLRFFETAAGWDGTTVGITYSSYAGMIGTYIPNDGRSPNATELAMENGMYPDAGTPLWIKGGTGITRGPVKIASITDGTSNTIGFAEMAHGKYEQAGCTAGGCCDWEGNAWWADADYSDSTISSFYPPNFPIPAVYYTADSSGNAIGWTNPDGCDPGNIPTISANSFHPGGINAAFADGSVHFIKSSISTWTPFSFARGTVNGAACVIPAGVTPGVWQALSTINGGEVISSDQY